MKNRIIIAAVTTSMFLFMVSSCYKNKEDILELPKVSFRGEVVPIMIAGGCGCHNNGVASRVVQFSNKDTIFYDAILARTGLFKLWVNGGIHPGAGSIDFRPNEKNTVKQWLDEGGQDDGGGCTVTGTVTYTTNIQPIYNTTCKGATCHGGIAVTLDYNKMVEEQATIQAMMNSGGSTGHPGGPISLSTCTVKTFNEWFAQGMPK